MYDIRQFGKLFLLLESKENLEARFQIILAQRKPTHQHLEKANNIVHSMDDKDRYDEAIPTGLLPNDTCPQNGKQKISVKLQDASALSYKYASIRPGCVAVRKSTRQAPDSAADRCPSDPHPDFSAENRYKHNINSI